MWWFLEDYYIHAEEAHTTSINITMWPFKNK